jgi:hypothetical protein
VLDAVLPGVRWSPSLRRLLAELDAMLTWTALEGIYRGPRWVAALVAMATRAGEEGGRRLAVRLAIAGRVGQTLATARERIEQLLAVASRRQPRPSQVAAAVEKAPEVIRVVTMAFADEDTRRVLHQALTAWTRVTLPFTGAELVAAGARPGPHVGEALRRTRAALQDGELAEAEALGHAARLARELAEARR